MFFCLPELIEVIMLNDDNPLFRLFLFEETCYSNEKKYILNLDSYKRMFFAPIKVFNRVFVITAFMKAFIIPPSFIQ